MSWRETVIKMNHLTILFTAKVSIFPLLQTLIIFTQFINTNYSLLSIHHV